MTGSNTPLAGYHRNSEMNMIGYVIGAGSAIMLLPLLPFILLYLVVDWLTGAMRSEPGADPDRFRASEPPARRREATAEAQSEG